MDDEWLYFRLSQRQVKDFDAEMNRLGGESWEAYAVTTKTDAHGAAYSEVWFKRRVVSAAQRSREVLSGFR